MKLKLHQKWRLLKEGATKKRGDQWRSDLLGCWGITSQPGYPVPKGQFVRRRVEVK